ncbi:unnamed protein product [Amaranthus hypochondriacus]
MHDYNVYSTQVSAVHCATPAAPRSWCPPDDGWVKANFDAYIGGDCCRGLGVVFRNHEGKALLAAVRRLTSNMGVEESELSAACFALEVATRMGFDHVQLESDAQAVISTIKRKQTGLSPIFSLYDVVHVLSDNLVGFSCSVVRRSGNTVAHSVARWDTGILTKRFVWNLFPRALGPWWTSIYLKLQV